MNNTEQRLAEDFRCLENRLNENTATELAERRRLALEVAASPSIRTLWKRWAMPSMGVAVASVLLVAVFLSPILTTGTNLKSASMETQLSESIELYENLEFYSWLADFEESERS